MDPRHAQLGDRLSEGTVKQRKQALSLMLSRISVSLTGEITEVEPQPWVQPLVVDLVAPSGDNKCPQGTSNARHVATLAALKPRKRDCTKISGNRRANPKPFLRSCPDYSATQPPKAGSQMGCFEPKS